MFVAAVKYRSASSVKVVALRAKGTLVAVSPLTPLAVSQEITQAVLVKTFAQAEAQVTAESILAAFATKTEPRAIVSGIVSVDHAGTAEVTPRRSFQVVQEVSHQTVFVAVDTRS